MLKKLKITKQTKRGETMITKNRLKVKKIIQEIVNKGKEITNITKPIGKFLTEGTMGMLLSGTSNLTEISRKLNEKSDIKHTLKRLQRMASSHEILNIANEICSTFATKEITNNTIIILDGGDIIHIYGKEFENITTVRDGSTKKYLQGYHLNQITGYDPKANKTFPIQLEMYSSISSNFKSANLEAFMLIKQTISKLGNNNLWAMDRGYDDAKYFGLMTELETDFIIRMTSTRNVFINKKPKNILKVAKQINRRNKYKNYGKYGTKKVTIQIPINGKKVFKDFTLISFKGKKNKNISYYITSGYVRSKKEIKRRLSGYFKRWAVEEGYRFEKQGFGIEKATVRNFKSIRSLLGLTLLSWLSLSLIDRSLKLKEEILNKSKMEKTKLKDRPAFIYYRLLKGLQILFEGAKCLFKFRLSREERFLRKLKSEQRSVFTLFDNLWLEVV
jgi:hypothetical protein